MSATTAIEWTDRTWNPVTGCRKVSPGCKHCYAEGVAHRFWHHQYVHTVERGFIPVKAYAADAMTGTLRKFTDVMTHEDRLLEPLSWKKPARVFVNSMSDLFHEDVPDAFIDQVFAVMALAPQHTFQVLTKRAKRMAEYLRRTSIIESIYADMCRRDESQTDGWCWPLPNVWLGVSVEDQPRADERIPLLLQTPAAGRFISAEPLLGPVDIGLSQASCGCCQRVFTSRWVRINRCLEADFPMNIVGARAGQAIAPGVHRASSNRHGALAVNNIGIRPAEFDALPALDWVIVGGESGHGARPCDVAWVRSIVRQCQAAGVPVFVKQLGAWVRDVNTAGFEGDKPGAWPMGKATCAVIEPVHQGDPVDVMLRNRKGGDPIEWPADLRVREFPR